MRKKLLREDAHATCFFMYCPLHDIFFLWYAGVDSFWYKEVQDAPMLEVMNRTMAGEHVWPDSAPVVQIGVADSSEFTERELDVLRCLALGYSNQEIADALYMSVNTVRFHIGNLISKTGLTSRIELAIAAAKSGIVTTV